MLNRLVIEGRFAPAVDQVPAGESLAAIARSRRCAAADDSVIMRILRVRWASQPIAIDARVDISRNLVHASMLSLLSVESLVAA